MALADDARLTYLWGWALVNAAKRAERAGQAAGNGPVLIQGTPVGYGDLAMQTTFVKPYERVICCPSHDLIYGSGVFHLTGSPGIVLQVPNFGNRFWVYSIYNGRTNEISTIGMQYGTPPGYQLVVGPGWQGPLPPGINGLCQSDTDLVFVIPRILTNGTQPDLDSILPLLNQICAYPFDTNTFDPTKPQTRQWQNLQNDDYPLLLGGPTEPRYVKPETFLTELRDALAGIPVRPGEQTYYDLCDELSGRIVLRPEIIHNFRIEEAMMGGMMQWSANGKSLANGWFTSVGAATWDVPDYQARTATAKSNMFENRATETKYFYTNTESGSDPSQPPGDPLFGSNQYVITFAKDHLLKGHFNQAFWSITVYNENHFFYDNTDNRYSLGSNNEASFVYEADGSLKLYVGPIAPPGLEKQWLPAPQGGHFSLYIRVYWPDDFILNDQWQPPQVALA